MEILEAYQRVGHLSSLYDGMMTNSSFLGRFTMKYFWQLSDEKYLDFISQAFAGIPENFRGRLLEIPIGTGILSKLIYKNLSEAEIIGVDYSEAMLSAAKINLSDVNNIKLEHGDVGNLRFSEEKFDVVLSLNGFHVFPNKQAAYSETHRVLKNGGTFCGCMYVKGQNWRTDFFVKHFCEKFGYFTPPYETIESLKEQLQKIYSKVKISNVESFAGFICKK